MDWRSQGQGIPSRSASRGLCRATIGGMNSAVLIALLLLPLAAAAQETPKAVAIETEAQLDEWLYRYYLHPQPEGVVPAMGYLDRSGNLRKDGYRRVVAAFLSEVFRQNRDRLEGWAKDLAGLGKQGRSVLFEALWRSGSKPGILALRALRETADAEEKAAIDRILGSIPVPPRLMPVLIPEHLDILWATFLASGDEAMVRRVIDCLPWSDEKEGRQLIGGAARWSLASNAEKHEKVMVVCRAEVEKREGRTREILREVIAKAEERLAAKDAKR